MSDQDTVTITSEQDSKIMRFLLQDAAAKLLPGERVAVCLRWRAPVNPAAGKAAYIWPTTDVFYNTTSSRASYRNLIVCNRIWHCPVCAARISEQRRKELTSASEASQYRVAMVTLTMRHSIRDSLSSMVTAITATYRALKSGRFWQDIKHEYSIVGDVRALEVTYGDNGWHVHIHALMFFDFDISSPQQAGLEAALKGRFLAILSKHGYDATWEHGLMLTAGNKDIRDYVAKFGRLPKAVPGATIWTIYHEVTKAHVKRSRADDGLTPWALLLAFTMGDKRAGMLFIEYAKTFKGYHQLQWSRGLKGLLRIEEVSDAEAGIDNDADYLMSIDAQTWDVICKLQKRAELLRKVGEENGEENEIRAWIETLIE